MTPLVLGLNTRKAATLGLADVKGSLLATNQDKSDRELMVDYTVAFTSDEPSLLKWCEDLIETLWREGVPLQ